MKVLRWLDAHFEEFILCVILCVIAIVMFIQIILRNVFSSSLAWSDELLPLPVHLDGRSGRGFRHEE